MPFIKSSLFSLYAVCNKIYGQTRILQVITSKIMWEHLLHAVFQNPIMAYVLIKCDIYLSLLTVMN